MQFNTVTAVTAVAVGAEETGVQMSSTSLGAGSAISLSVTHALASTQNTRTPATSVWVGNRLAKIHTHLCQGTHTGVPQTRGSLVAALVRRHVTTHGQVQMTTPVQLVNSERALNVASVQNTAAPLWFLANAEAGRLVILPSLSSRRIDSSGTALLLDDAQRMSLRILPALPLYFDVPEQTAPALLKQSTAVSVGRRLYGVLSSAVGGDACKLDQNDTATNFGASAAELTLLQHTLTATTALPTPVGKAPRVSTALAFGLGVSSELSSNLYGRNAVVSWPACAGVVVVVTPCVLGAWRLCDGNEGCGLPATLTPG